MSAWKQFLASDIIVTPFTVNKGFAFPYSQWATGSDGQLVGVDRFLGKNVDWYIDQSTTGTLSTQYQALIYSSIKQLYYSNYISSSTGDTVGTSSIFPGSNSSGNVLVGPIQSPLYDNYLQSTLTPTRFIPTGSGDTIGVISIPSKLYGDYIVPNSFRFTSASVSLIDDGEGNVIVEVNGANFGNIIYTQGLIILTNSSSYSDGAGGGATFEGYGYDDYGVDTYGAGDAVPSISSFITSTNVTCSFSSSITIYETQYKCTIRENEFNLTLNPSARDSDGNLNNNVTGSFFSPYVTTVGLYDEMQNLLAVGKLAQPLPTSNTTDLTILVNIDK